MKKSSYIAVVIRICYKYLLLSFNLGRNIKNIISKKCYQNSIKKPHATMGHSGISSLNGKNIPTSKSIAYLRSIMPASTLQYL